MNLKSLKEYFSDKNNNFLKDEILTIYKKFDFIKEYYDAKLGSQSIETIVLKYKAILEKQIHPKKGFPELKYSIARKAISDFKKICSDAKANLDLQLTYVEHGVECSLEYGDIDEKFYDSMESMFRKSLFDMKKFNLLDIFEARCRLIQQKTRDMGWGFGDAITDLYSEFYEKQRILT